MLLKKRDKSLLTCGSDSRLELIRESIDISIVLKNGAFGIISLPKCSPLNEENAPIVRTKSIMRRFFNKFEKLIAQIGSQSDSFGNQAFDENDLPSTR
jgi:hypothetical protein